MSLDARQLAELDSLLAALADDRLSSEGRAQLETLLEAEPEAREHYVRFMALCSDLHDYAATALSAAEDDLDDPPLATTASRSRGAFGRWRPAWTVAGIAAGVATVMLAVAWGVVRWLPPRDQAAANEAGAVVGRLENLVGLVKVADGLAAAGPAEQRPFIRTGQTVSTRGVEAKATIRLPDGTALLIAGDTRVVFPENEPDRVHVEFGNMTAVVRPRPAGRPLVISTSEATTEVLGTQLVVSRDGGRTRVVVIEGDVRLTRFSDERSVTLAAGQAAEVSARADLRPAPRGETPDHWSLDFGDGLPDGWQTGQLVFDDLPEGSKAAVRAAGVIEHGQRRYHLRSHNAWTNGLFTLHEDTWIHVRYRLERPGTFLLYIVCRQRDFGEPVATVLTPGNLRQTEAGRWHTLTLSISSFRRARSGNPVPLDGQLVAFQLVFDTPEHNPGLTVERIWVTRGTPADPRPPIEPHETVAFNAAP